jgi:hypothetical protein
VDTPDEAELSVPLEGWNIGILIGCLHGVMVARVYIPAQGFKPERRRSDAEVVVDEGPAR